MNDLMPPTAFKGRAAISNTGSRFEPLDRIGVDDGWTPERPARPRTEVRTDSSRSVIARNQSPDLPFDRSVNPYRGCEHGCIYCFARPSHAYLGLSPGLDFETRIFAKDDAPSVLERDLRKKGYRCAALALGANTDPYQPIERDKKITRGVLEVLAAYRHPVMIVTKSSLILRDLDILAPMAARGLVSVAVSVTTLDPHLARVMEPRACTPRKRLGAITGLSEAGVPVSLFASPMIPALNDPEIETLLQTGAEAGAQAAGMILLRLPLEIAGLFDEWLQTHYPDRRNRVLDLMRQCRGGKLYDSAFGARMTGVGPYAELLRQRFHRALRVNGLTSSREQPDLPINQFKAPANPLHPAKGDQLALF